MRGIITPTYSDRGINDERYCYGKGYFNKIFTRLPQERHQIAKTRLKLLKQYKSRIQTILDIGCGYGDFLAVCAQAGIKTYGTDVSTEALKYTQSLIPGVILQRVDSGNQKLPFKDNYFDAVSCFDVVEHLDKTDLLFSEGRRVLKSRGIFFLITPPVTSLGKLLNQFIKDDPTHINRQQVSFWEKQLVKFGFKILAEKYAYLFGFPPTNFLRSIFRELGLPTSINPSFSAWREICAVLYLFAEKVN